MSEVRTRFAPSPTGYLHVGGARTALFNYFYAKAKKGKFILRIEDTDVERSTDESYHQMLESLKWLNLTWDEGPEVGGPHESYRQSERLNIYLEHAHLLLESQHAYRCFCSTEELEIKKKKREAMGLPPVYDKKCANLTQEEISEKLSHNHSFTIRFKTPDHEIIVTDVVQGEIRFDSSLIGDFIIIKSNNYPSYNFAVVVDDHLMDINHVIRGVGHLSNTPRQIAIYQAFNWSEPVWAHVSEIVGSDHKKLSKRHGATAITAFRDLGYSPESFINYISLLGWSPPDGNELMTVDKIISQFDITRCSKSPSMFDVFDLNLVKDIELSSLSAIELEPYLFKKSKLNWISNLHIRGEEVDDYIKHALPFIRNSKKITENEVNKDNKKLTAVLLALRVYTDYYLQLTNYITDFYSDEFNINGDAMAWLKKDQSLQILKEFLSEFKQVEKIEEKTTKTIAETISKKLSVKGKELFMPLRAGITGKLTGLELPVFVELLEREKVIQHLEYSINHCATNE